VIGRRRKAREHTVAATYRLRDGLLDLKISAYGEVGWVRAEIARIFAEIEE
jgi:hypothetical protein